MDDPPVVSPQEWLAARRTLLAREKEFTRQHDALNTERRRAPLAKIEPFRQRMGWSVPWYSSFGSDFNYLTARGRQEDWEQPPGRGNSPALGWLRHHDRYDTQR